MVLAVRTVAITAGMWHESLMITLSVLCQHLGAGYCAAILHGRERLERDKENPILVLLEERGLKGVDNR